MPVYPSFPGKEAVKWVSVCLSICLSVIHGRCVLRDRLDVFHLVLLQLHCCFLLNSYKHGLDGLYRVLREEGALKLMNGATMASSRATLVTIGQVITANVAPYITTTTTATATTSSSSITTTTSSSSSSSSSHSVYAEWH